MQQKPSPQVTLHAGHSLQSCGCLQGHRNTTCHCGLSVPTLGQQLTTLPMVEAVPHSLNLGAKPSHSSPSLENSTTEGGRDERICAWRRPNIPRTRSVCGPPKGLNYFCSTGGQIPKIPGNGAHVPWVGLMTSLGNKKIGRALGCTGSLNHWSLVPTLPGSRETSTYTLVPCLTLIDCVALSEQTNLLL